MPIWLLEAIKEFFRVIVLAIVPVLIAGLEAGFVDWRVILTIAAVAGLRFIDKALHKIGVEKSSEPLVKGLTRF